jgi:hypothetical protein
MKNKKIYTMGEEEQVKILLSLQESLKNILSVLPLKDVISNGNIYHTSSESFSILKEESQPIKSGRKRKHQLKEGDKIHDKYSEDNILRKIQVHYLNFITDVVNELLTYLGYTIKFIDIDYNEKKKVTKKQLISLRKSNIGKILCQKVSPKFKIKSKEVNNNIVIFNQVKENKIVNDFLSKNYYKLFKDVYLQDKKIFNENGLCFHFSEKVQTFEDFLKKTEKYDDNGEYKRTIDSVIQKYFFKLKIFKVKNKKSKKK